MSRTSNSSSLLIVLIIVFTFPIWIGIFGGMVGLFFGLLGGFFGLVGGILGAIFGAIGAAFKGIFHALFGWGGFWPHAIFNKYLFFAVVILAAVAIQKRQQKR